jgi:hypothetical protein
MNVVGKSILLCAACLELLFSGCNPSPTPSGVDPVGALCAPLGELARADAELSLALESARVSDLAGTIAHSTSARQHEELARTGIGSGHPTDSDAAAKEALVSTVVAIDQAANVFFDADVPITDGTKTALAKLAETAHQELIRAEAAISNLGMKCA